MGETKKVKVKVKKRKIKIIQGDIAYKNTSLISQDYIGALGSQLR